MDSSTSRKSEAAATRKRRSSILKSQRCVRAPLSELEFNVATPDQAKSRRVSFSRRTGVAEFEINEATTAWKNVYEEHNKSLESSANESALKAAPRRVGHLGARAGHFQDDEAEVVDTADSADTTEAPAPPAALLDELPTNTNTIQLFRLESNPGLRELTDNLNVDFSEMAPLADDLDALGRALERREGRDGEPPRDNIAEITIDVDFNATHLSLGADDDMSITDTIRGPAVAAPDKPVDDWTVDKENIVVNPYVAPPPAEFPCEDDVLVFDGKKCKFQSKLDLSDTPLEFVGTENIPPETMFLDDMIETRAIPVEILQANVRDKSAINEERRTVMFGNDDGDISVTEAVANNIVAPKAAREDKGQKTMYFNDLADMSVTQALPADIIQSEPRHKTILYEDDAHISMTEAVPARVLASAGNLGLEANMENKRRTIVYEDADVSMTGVVSGNIHVKGDEDLRKTIVYGNHDGNVSMTGVLTTNIIDELKIEPNMDQRKSILYGDKDGHVSITEVLPANIIDEAKLVPPPNTDRRKTIVYGNDNGNLSVTSVLPSNIIDEAKLTQLHTDRRRTVVFGNDDGNRSMAGVAPINILDGAKYPNAERRKTILYDNDGGNISMTGVLPANILDGAKVTQEPDTDRRKTIVYDNDGGNISMTGVLPANILDGAKVTQEPDTDRRKTIVYENDECNIAVTGVVPANILDEAKQIPADCRKTVEHDKNNGKLSKTGVLPPHILGDGAEMQPLNAERRKTVVYDEDNGNLSMTGVVPVSIFDGANQQNIENIKSLVYANDDGNLVRTAVASELFEDAKEQLDEQQVNEPNTEPKKSFGFGDDGNDVSRTGIIPANKIEEGAKLIQFVNEERRKTSIVSENEDGNVCATKTAETNRENIVYANTVENMSVTGAKLDKDDRGVESTQPSDADRRKAVVYEEDDGNMSITGVIPNIIDEAKSTQAPNERRQTVVYEDNDVSMTDIVPANIKPEDTNIVVPETPTSIICENTETKKDEPDFDEKDQPEMIEAVTISKLIESYEELEEGDVSMTQADRPQPPKNLCSTTFNKSLANQDVASLNKSLPGQIMSAIDNTLPDQTFDEFADPRSATINKSLAGQIPTALEKSFPKQEQTFNKSLAGQVHPTTLTQSPADVTNTLEKSQVDPYSATFNKSLARQELAANKSIPGQESATLNTSFAGQECPTITKSLTGHSTSMNKTLTSNVLVYGATTEREAKDSDNTYIVDGFNLEDNQSQESPNVSLVLSKSSTEQLARSRAEAAAMTPPKESVLDVLLDMSQASDPEDVLNKPQSNTATEPVSIATEPVSSMTVTDSVPCSESYILVKDDEPELEVSTPLAIEYKKQKHGIVCKLQRKLSELKDTLLVKPKSPKKEKIKGESQDLTQKTSNLDTPKTTDSFDKGKLSKPSLKSTSSPNKDVHEKIKSVNIELTSDMSMDEEQFQVENQIQTDLTSIEDKEEINATKCQANDTKAILDALSDFTDTRRSGDFEPAPSPDKTKRSSIPDRKSIVISREDLMREISMAQALMKTEMAQTEVELDATEGSSDDQEPSPPRLGGEVVKTLRFEDDSILEPKILQKSLSSDSSPRRTSSVIPTYEISDPVKELMKDLIKPLADVEQPSLAEPCQSSQADRVDSSQIDLIPAKSILVSPRSCLRKNEQEVAHSEMHVDTPPRKEPEPVIVFDHLNPLNNIVIPPLDRAVVHKYNPVQSGHSISPSIPSTESRCCQTGAPEPRRVVGVALTRPTVDRGVASGARLRGSAVDRAVATSYAVQDCEVNTTIVMKGNRELLAESSSLTLVDDVLPRSPVRVIFQLDEPDSSVQLDSDLSSIQDFSDHGRKRGHVAGKGPEVTPKPAIKVSRRRRSQSPAGKEIKESSPSSRGTAGSSLTVAQLYACARSDVSATDSRCSRVSDWRPELLHEASSKNLVAEQDAGVNVVAKIDVLPFMGTSECEWESRAADTWTFRLLRARLRLLIRLEHRATNTTRVLVRADTPVKLVTVQHVTIDEERTEPVAALCLCLAAETLQRICARGVASAGAVPALLRRCAAVSRVALHWGRCMRHASSALAFSLSQDGCLSLKVANIPLRSVWEITLRVELCDDGRGWPHPRAEAVRVAPVVAAWLPAPAALRALLQPVPRDWGHVPRTIWKIFKYLKNKSPEDPDLNM